MNSKQRNDDEYANSAFARRNKVIKLVAIIAMLGLMVTTAVTMGIATL